MGVECSGSTERSQADLIFVTNITNIISGKKLSCGEILAFYV